MKSHLNGLVKQKGVELSEKQWKERILAERYDELTGRFFKQSRCQGMFELPQPVIQNDGTTLIGFSAFFADKSIHCPNRKLERILKREGIAYTVTFVPVFLEMKSLSGMLVALSSTAQVVAVFQVSSNDKKLGNLFPSPNLIREVRGLKEASRLLTEFNIHGRLIGPNDPDYSRYGGLSSTRT